MTFDDDLSDLLAETEVWLHHFGINWKSSYLTGLLKASKKPSDRALCEQSDLQWLVDELESRWNALPPQARDARLRVQRKMAQLRVDWHTPKIRDWVAKQKTPFTGLSAEQLGELEMILDKAIASMERGAA